MPVYFCLSKSVIMKISIQIIFFTFLTFASQAQITDPSFQPQSPELKKSVYQQVNVKPTANDSSGNISIHESWKIRRLDSLTRANPPELSGFRVQIFFGSKDEALKKRTEFLKKYPEVPAYISFLAPNFRVRVGDFRLKLDSEHFKADIEKQFPNCYIVKDNIQLPSLDPTQYEPVDKTNSAQP